MRFFTSLPIVVGLAASRAHAVTLTTTAGTYTVNAGSADTFEVGVSRTNCDITSLLYKGKEIQSSGSMKTHINSGLGSGVTVEATPVTHDGVDFVKITCSTGTLTHYIVVRDGDSTVHMATHVTVQPTINELRFLARLSPTLIPNDDVDGASNTAGGTAIEAKDVFTVGGKTRAKFYSSMRFIEDQVHCFTGSTMSVCIVAPGNAYETSSGGPFMRDINTNGVGDANHISFYMNSQHAQTEKYRTGLFGPYALQFSSSGRPSGTQDFTFWAGLGAKDYVPTEERGYVSGSATGLISGQEKVVHWYNDVAQYWTVADTAGIFKSPAMKPGTYTQVLYQGELLVAEETVAVTAGSTSTKNIASTWTAGPKTLFQIGVWDGTPLGFRNAANQLRMHPSDARMAAWGPLTYTVGTSALSDFPMAVFKNVSTPLTIKFTLTDAEASGAATLRIGTTISFKGGRPDVSLGSTELALPAAPVVIDSRGVTRGAYRGRGETYNFDLKAGSLVAGVNTITINVLSGSSGEGFLAPNFIFDAVHLFR